MSFIQYVSPRNGAGVFLAVAAYEGVSAPFVMSLFSSRAAIARDMGLEIFAGNCHVDDSRNRLVRDFLESDCDQMIFLDADVSWLDSDLCKLIDYQEDIVAGIYPMKNDEVEYPVKPLPGPRYANAQGLVEVEGVPTGFLKIRRRLLESLAPTVPSHIGRGEPDRMRIPVLFERTLNGDSRRGGDYEFCRKARAAGFKVYVDPLMQLSHTGVKLWSGCVGHWWRRDVAIPDGIGAIRAGKDKPETYLEMYNVWGNNWALRPEALYTGVQLARAAQGPVLDCGSGLSSLCVAAATTQPVVALESSPVWADKVTKLARDNHLDNLQVVQSDIVDYDRFQWYQHVPTSSFSLILCDGPPLHTGRMGLFHLLEPTCPVLVDDMAHASYRRDVEAWAASRGRRLEIMESSRLFGLVL